MECIVSRTALVPVPTYFGLKAVLRVADLPCSLRRSAVFHSNLRTREAWLRIFIYERYQTF
jgi:hypothetical protein